MKRREEKNFLIFNVWESTYIQSEGMRREGTWLRIQGKKTLKFLKFENKT
jgi:hypothetical protein